MNSTQKRFQFLKPCKNLQVVYKTISYNFWSLLNIVRLGKIMTCKNQFSSPTMLFYCQSDSLPFDPRDRPTVTAGSDHQFQTRCLYIRPSVRPHFSTFQKNKTTFKWSRIVDRRDCVPGRVDHIDDTHVLCFFQTVTPLA